MITYSKNFWGLPHLLRPYGSAIPRTIAFAVLSSGLTALFHYLPYRGYFEALINHPYPYQVFALIVGFTLVFRTNQGYQRYWEGCTQLQAMTGALLNVCSLALAYEAATVAVAQLDAPSKGFHGCPLFRKSQQQEGGHIDVAGEMQGLPSVYSIGSESEEGADCPPKGAALPCLPDSRIRQVIHFRNQLLHIISLFHGLALQHLRSDWRLGNLSLHDEARPPPPPDGRGLAKLLSKYHIAVKDTRRSQGVSRQWGRFYRPMKIPVLGSISQRERSLLKEHLEPNHQDTVIEPAASGGLGQERMKVSILWELFGGWNSKPGLAVEGAPERLYTVYLWLELLVAGRTRETDANRWRIPATLSTNTMAQMSAAMQAFEQCRKLASVPFPFPWAQTVVLLLLLFTLTLPLLMSAFMDGLWMSMLLTFLPVLTYWALNEVASDLEDPFHYDPNELPLARQQFEFNKRLLAAAESALDFLSVEEDPPQ